MRLSAGSVSQKRDGEGEVALYCDFVVGGVFKLVIVVTRLSYLQAVAEFDEEY